MLIFLYTGSRSGREMFVMSASVDPQNPAERLNTVLKTELVDSV